MIKDLIKLLKIAFTPISDIPSYNRCQKMNHVRSILTIKDVRQIKQKVLNHDFHV